MGIVAIVLVVWYASHVAQEPPRPETRHLADPKHDTCSRRPETRHLFSSPRKPNTRPCTLHPKPITLHLQRIGVQRYLAHKKTPPTRTLP